MSTLMAVLWVSLWVILLGSVALAAVWQCPRCGAWHISKDEQDKCKEGK